MLEQFTDIHVDNSKHEMVTPIDISNIDATNDTVTQKKAK